MSEKIIIHKIHGEDLHDLSIYLAERYLKNKNCTIKPPLEREIFKKKTYYPGEPDIIFSFIEKGKKYIFIVEIETSASKFSIEKKTNQFKLATSGIDDLLIINLDEYNGDYANWKELEEFIIERLPI